MGDGAFKRFLHGFGSALRPAARVAPPAERSAEDLLEERRERFREGVRRAVEVYTEDRLKGGLALPRYPLEPYVPPKGVCPPERVLAADSAWKNLAQDAGINVGAMLTTMNGITASVLDGMGFPGFPFLTELTQLTEYRDMSERTAAEMTRKWVKLRSTSKAADKQSVIDVVERELKRHRVRDLFRYAATIDGFMGRCMLFPNLGDVVGEELESPLMLNPAKVRKGSLRGFKVVEPITTYPAAYNASNPLASDYYVPSAWFVYGQKVHASRLLNFVSRPLPDLLKPVYNFSGMSMSQLAQPYVDYWFGTRDSVGKLLKNFSITTLATDLDVLLAPGGDDLLKRAKMFTRFRDNQGLFLINKDKEALTQLNTPLSGLADLQAQAQEHMAAVAKTPLVVLLGITPKGLNSTNDGDLRIYYDYVADQQDNLFRRNLDFVIKLIMLDQLGYIDEDITFDFVSLFELNDKDKATIRKSDGDLAVELVQVGAISPLEVRTKLAADPDSGYDNLNVDALPEPPQPQDPGAQAQPDVPAEASSAAAGVSLDALRPARRMAEDGGFRGNQFLGGFPDSEHPSTAAMRLSGHAAAASHRAKKLGTAATHRQAALAHERARASHERALPSAPDHLAHVHRAYADAHGTAAEAHRSVLPATAAATREDDDAGN